MGLDALFGNVFSESTQLELRGGLNFTDGLQAVENPTEGRIDVSLVELLDSAISLGGLELSSAVATTISASSTWYTLAGTYVASSFNGANWTAGSSSASLTWNGAGTATVLAFASLLPSSVTAKTIGFRFAVAGTGASRTEQQIYSASVGPSAALIGGFEVGAGEAVTVEVCNYTDTNDVTASKLSIVLVAFGGVDASA